MDNSGNLSLPDNQEQTSDEQKSDAQERIDFLRAVVPPRQKHTKRNVAIAFVCGALALIIGFGIYGIFSSSKSSSTSKVQSSSKSTSPKPSNNIKAPSVPTQSYTSSNYSLSLNYPDGWSIVDNGSGPLTITSPGMQLSDDNGKTVTGLVTMSIQKQGQLPPAFTAGTALAVLNSQTITYSQPTTNQTSQTYLSFVQYSSTNTIGGLDAIYLTGNYGYQKDQIIPSSDISNINPLVITTFTRCGNASCTSNLTPLTISSSSWSKASFQAPLLTMLSSLAFQ